MIEEEFEKLWHRLVKQVHGPNPIALTKHERLFYAANWLRGSIPRSGLYVYFDTSTGDDVRDAREALQLMGLDDVVALLDRAVPIALRNQPLPVGNSPIELVSRELSDEAYAQAMNDLDAALGPVQDLFYECEDKIFDAICRFADQHGLR